MRVRIAVATASLSALAAACATSSSSGIHVTGENLQRAFDHWEATVSSETREIIKQMKTDPTLLIHVREGKVIGYSRGASSSVGSGRDLKERCSMHPASDDISSERNWDVVYDGALREKMEKQLKLPSPIEALLHHEIIGHIAPALSSPRIIEIQRRGDQREKDKIEDNATRKENEYRQTIGLPPVRIPSDGTRGDHGN